MVLEDCIPRHSQRLQRWFKYCMTNMRYSYAAYELIFS